MTACVMIMAGGTGGHVFPALAAAEELRAQGAEVFWLGTRQGLEAQLVPQAGIDIEWISIAGLRGKGVLGWLLAPLRLLKAMFQSLEVIMRRRPMAVLGMGGFVSGPGGLVTWLLRKPLLIHEQNAIAGLTNRLLAHAATTVMEAFPGTFAKGRAIDVGNPVRESITELPAPGERIGAHQGALRLLVIGGSLGARALNDILPEALAGLAVEQPRPEVWHQAGQRNIEAAEQAYRDHGVENVRLVPFIENMAEAYAWADLVLCRAGALTVSELAAAGVGSLLVPFPHAVDDHQTANAHYLADAGAALLLPQSELTPDRLREVLKGFMRDCAEGREQLKTMAEKARQLARTDAAAKVAGLCLEACHG